MNTRQYLYLLTVAQKKSVSAAARELMISQPALSQYIQKIEEEYGVQFFDRTLSELKLTKEGEYYTKIARDILDKEEELKRYFEDLKECKTGDITIAASPYSCTFILPEVIEEFKKEYPGVHIRLDNYWASELNDASLCGKFDIALTMRPKGRLEAMNCEEIYSDSYILLVPENSEINQKLADEGLLKWDNNDPFPIVDFTAFKDEPFIGWRQGSIFEEHFEKLCRRCDIEPKIAMECYTAEPIYYMVKHGIGVAHFPHDIAVRIIQRNGFDGIKAYRIEQSKEHFEKIILYKKDMYISNSMRRLMDIIKEHHRYNLDV